MVGGRKILLFILITFVFFFTKIITLVTEICIFKNSEVMNFASIIQNLYKFHTKNFRTLTWEIFLEAIVCKRALKALLMASRKSACLAKSKTQN